MGLQSTPESPLGLAGLFQPISENPRGSLAGGHRRERANLESILAHRRVSTATG
jgi:hypothetical protein